MFSDPKEALLVALVKNSHPPPQFWHLQELKLVDEFSPRKESAGRLSMFHRLNWSPHYIETL
jgi:hypothetical protein